MLVAKLNFDIGSVRGKIGQEIKSPSPKITDELINKGFCVIAGEVSTSTPTYTPPQSASKPSNDEIDAMTYKQLRKACKQYKKKNTGNKADMIGRLKSL